MKLNETPVRTSKNFNINNIEIKDFKKPSSITEFNSLTITGDTSKFSISNDVSKKSLVYGNSKELEKEVYEKANKEIKLKDLKSGILNLNFKLNKENSKLIENIDITANTKSKTTIIIKYNSEDLQEYYHNGIIRLKAEADSNTNIIIVNMLNEKSNNFLSIENELAKNARVDYIIIDFGGKNSVTNYYSNLTGVEAENNIKTIYLGKDNQLFDLNYIGELRGEKSNIDIDVQGALKGNSTKHFKGTIDFKKGCKKAQGNENEYCMLLSDTAKSISLPMLLCSEENVEGNHSSAAGKIGEKELFYIMSRGFELKEAMKLMVKAKFNKILAKIADEELKEIIFNEIDKRLE